MWSDVFHRGEFRAYGVYGFWNGPQKERRPTINDKTFELANEFLFS